VSELLVKLPTPHKAQQDILDSAGRFNHLRCGRRFGKTMLITELSSVALDGYPVGIWFPTYKDLSEVWKEAKEVYKNVIIDKNEQLKQLNIIGGGLIDFWGMEEPESGQGRKYKRAIIDESAKAPKLKEAWENTIRPTLADLIGDAWIMSRPKGTDNPFYKIEEASKGFDDWRFFHYTTYDNPYIDKDEIEAAKVQLPTDVFDQEYMAEYIDATRRPFMYAFDEKHIGKPEFNPKLTTYLSFDFNVDPITCIIAQLSAKDEFIYILDEFRLNNSNIYELCDRILASAYGKSFKIITGDATGLARTTTTKGNINNYTIICEKLTLNPDGQLILPNRNPPIDDNRTLCNALLYSHPDLLIHERCRYLIEDFRFVQVNDKGDIDKTTNTHRSHLLDTFRYLCNTFFGDYVTKTL
jgi:hypothetical protein